LTLSEIQAAVAAILDFQVWHIPVFCYDACSRRKKLTDSQLSLPHGMNKNVKEKKLKIN